MGSHPCLYGFSIITYSKESDQDEYNELFVTWLTKPTDGSFSKTEIDDDKKFGDNRTSLFNKQINSVWDSSTYSFHKWFNGLLKPGGQAFIHHSWLYGGSDESVYNVAGRANMSPEQFKTFVVNNNMEIVSQVPIHFEPLNSWNGMDCISMFRKPL